MLKGIGTAALVLVLALPATASAVDWVVDPAGGPCTSTDRTCPTIQGAVTAAATGDTVRVRPRSPGWDEAVTISNKSLTVVGDGPGQVRVLRTLTFSGAGTTLVLQRLALTSSSGPAVAVTNQDVDPDKSVLLQSSVLSGGGDAAIKATTAALSLNDVSIVGRHVTVADAAGAAAFAETEGSPGGSVTAAFHDSIVQGAAAGATQTNPQPADTNNANLFVDHGAEDFRLRVGSAAIDQGGGRQASEWETDFEGEARAGAWDRGGDEFVNRRPDTPSLGPTNFSPTAGEAVGFFAAGTDPDAPLGDAIVEYRWSFGDGATATTSANSVAHAYGAPGTYQAVVRTVDRSGAVSLDSAPVTITVRDPAAGGSAGGAPVPFSITQLPGFENGLPAQRGPEADPPMLAFVSPRAGGRVRVGRRAPMLRGKTADLSGVRRVELALMRRAGARCLWFDGRRAFVPGRCGDPRWFKAVLDDYDWRYAFPRNVRPAPGAYAAFVRATDYRGNRTTAFGAHNAVSFRYAR